MRALLRWIVILVALAAALTVTLVGFGTWWMYRGLAQLDGSSGIHGLGAPVSIERDALGIPTIHAQSRIDAARALGFLHAQDRFFQMDLMRRRSAGELSELFGKKTLEADKLTRLHEFRKRAVETLAAASPKDRALLSAYADGVNAGYASLRARPFEYLILRTKPTAWAVEDTLLVGYSIVLDLEDSTAKYKRDLAAITSAYGFVGLNFFAPVMTPDDAALDGSTGPLGPPPKPSNINLHESRESAQDGLRGNDTASDLTTDRIDLGSNSLALDGAHAGGAALIGNDIHLTLRVPGTWYRARMEWPGHAVTGITLPGVPFLIAGSNGHIAWGFTVGYADMGDLVTIRTTLSPTMYDGPTQGDSLTMDTHTETIHVRGESDVTLETHWTRWGPILPGSDEQKPMAYLWAFDQPGAVDFAFGKLETAQTAAEAVEIGKGLSMPCLNMMVGDSQGHIAWTLVGSVPKRTGYDGRTPVTFAFSDRSWSRLPAAEHPSVIDPASGYLWTGNQRPVGGAALATIGDGGYARPARATQLRDDLKALVARGTTAAPADLLAIELDDRAVFLSRWRDVLLKSLGQAPAGERYAALKDIVANHWDGHAATSSTSYRLVKAFRLAVATRVFEPIMAKPLDRYDAFDWKRLNYEAPLEQMLKDRPLHLLDSAYPSWDDLLLKAADDVVDQLGGKDGKFGHATWGEANIAAIRHPFSLILPLALTSFLNMPADPLAGDTDMPRVMSPTNGASIRFAVSPGKENQGLMEMPCGESGNPVSPYYKAGHEAWVHGEPTPFLPGRALHTLTLNSL